MIEDRKKVTKRKQPKGPFDDLARSFLRPHKLVNEVWATMDCYHPCFYRFFIIPGSKSAVLKCAECGYVYYPSSTRVDSVCYAIGPAL